MQGVGRKDDVSDYKGALLWFEKCATFDDPTVQGTCESHRDELRGLVREAEDKVGEVSRGYGDEFEIQFEPM